jgi:hypothetical protein
MTARPRDPLRQAIEDLLKERASLPKAKIVELAKKTRGLYVNEHGHEK